MPQVALETAVLTHGLPRPINVDTALRLETIVREAGGTPCTIGLVDGRLERALTEESIRYLGTAANVRKISLHNLASASASGASGGTTVAATIHVAAMHGIQVFATGGIGGVHRSGEGEQTFDVSADLLALARNPVCTVCSGAKSILDLPATVESLETLGVPVIGFQTDQFPAFYSRESGLALDTTVDSADEVAAIVRSQAGLGLASGVLVVAPVPPGDAIPMGEIEPAIAEAVRDSRQQGIRGPGLTPFLLNSISQRFGARALRANVSLLEQNARLAADIACALHRL